MKESSKTVSCHIKQLRKEIQAKEDYINLIKGVNKARKSITKAQPTTKEQLINTYKLGNKHNV